ncbi:MAG: 16S rRNA (cytosine(1402)-N(4))-methyltransferase RsmH [Flavobacteriales bacterium]|nr:16S rRNA (cytosine(1402)-N(4))-methyltransferase RsmH [Flavobacteriales bacterium]
MDNTSYHLPVLLGQSIDGLNIKPDGVYVDVTFGGGGHSREILSRLEEKGRLFAFDQDKDALKNTIDDPRFTLINQNFRYMKNYLRFHGVTQVDGILADLGVSSHQFDTAGRGFSIREDGPLDMRMNPEGSLSAHDIVNQYPEDDLSSVLYKYGELRENRAVASRIMKNRPLETTMQLINVLKGFVPQARENKFYAQVFQALRIEANDEMGALEEFLMQSGAMLAPKGRLSVISYHSLEDRLVKNYMRAGNFEGEVEKDFYGNAITPLRPVNRKVIVPTNEEIAINNRARSAKLRVGEKI